MNSNLSINQNNIFSILNNIYSTNGKDKNYWKDLLVSIKNDSSFPGIIKYFNQRIKNEPSNILNLDILDFLIDYGHINLLRELSKNDLMMNVFTIKLVIKKKILKDLLKIILIFKIFIKRSYFIFFFFTIKCKF